MKKIYLFIFLVLVQMTSYSQDIFPLHNVKWVGIYSTCMGIDYEQTYFSYIIQGDTIVDNIKRSKCYYIPDINKPDTLLIGYFNIVDSVVYFQIHKNEDGTYSRGLFGFCEAYNSNRPLYDFSLKEGDTFNYTCFDDEGWSMKVTSIGQEYLGGIMRKKIFFNGSDNIYWIEGMGSSLGFFEDIEAIPTSEDSYDYICFSVNDEVLYMNPAYSECPVSQLNSIQKIATNQLSIFPNPIKSTGTLQSNQPLALIQIYNVYGALVREQVCNGELQAHIEKQSLSSGMYIYKALDLAGNNYSGKFVIK